MSNTAGRLKVSITASRQGPQTRHKPFKLEARPLLADCPILPQVCMIDVPARVVLPTQTRRKKHHRLGHSAVSCRISRPSQAFSRMIMSFPMFIVPSTPCWGGYGDCFHQATIGVSVHRLAYVLLHPREQVYRLCSLASDLFVFPLLFIHQLSQSLHHQLFPFPLSFLFRSTFHSFTVLRTSSLTNKPFQPKHSLAFHFNTASRFIIRPFHLHLLHQTSILPPPR